MDFEVARCSRKCSVTGRELAEGEEFYSALVSQGSQVCRLDYARESWSVPAEGLIGWWKSRVPHAGAKRPRMAPSDVLLDFFRSLEGSDREDARYVMALVLVRRRILRLEETVKDDDGGEALSLYCARDESTHRVRVHLPTEERTRAIQDELNQLLFASAT